MNITDLKLGESAFINTIVGDNKLTKRLLALGCVEGTKVTLKTLAPLGDPIVINIRGFDLAIRKKDAKCIEIVDTIKQMKTA